MKIICTGTTYKVYDDNLKTYDKLPACTYMLGCGQFTGFYLEKQENVAITEKIYGTHKQKVDKILNSFKVFERNLGVILSGEKGIGKSIAAKLLAQEAITQDLPVILVNHDYSGLAEFIDSIKQEVIVIFDEFDKTFSKDESQAELLTLLDGFGSGKKLYVITCNELRNVNDFLVNRPGRFHYHLRFGYPTADEIREYLKDKLEDKYYSQIEDVIKFSGKVNLNYDCLRAIAFELNLGLKFSDAITDLNILNYSRNYEEYTSVMILKNGQQLHCKNTTIDFTEDDDNTEVYYNLNKNVYCRVRFNPARDAYYDTQRLVTVIPGDAITDIKYVDSSKDERVNLETTPAPIVELIFKRRYANNYSYNYMV